MSFFGHPCIFLIKCLPSSLPASCEVNSPDIHDVLLDEDYAQLPNLTCVFHSTLDFNFNLIFRAGSFRSWSSATGDGYVMFSGWAKQLPELDIE